MKVSQCACGRVKDRRAEKCAICSHKSYSVGNKDSGSDRFSKDQIIDAVAKSKTYSAAAKLLGCSRHTITRLVGLNKLDTSHMRRTRGRLPSDEHIFKHGDKRRNTTVKNYVLEKKLIPYVCYTCGQLPEWNEKPLALQLDHKDGDPTNDVKENLGFLCPNCHSQTDTFCGRNK
jgi:hypothetical protein